MSTGKQTSLINYSSTTLRTDFVQILAFIEHSTGERGRKIMLSSYSYIQEHIFVLNFPVGCFTELNVTILKTPLMN